MRFRKGISEFKNELLNESDKREEDLEEIKEAVLGDRSEINPIADFKPSSAEIEESERISYSEDVSRRPSSETEIEEIKVSFKDLTDEELDFHIEKLKSDLGLGLKEKLKRKISPDVKARLDKACEI